MGHTARFDHSGHDFPHTEVRVRRAAPSIRNNGSEKDGWNRRWGEEGENKIGDFSLSRVWFLEREALGIFSKETTLRMLLIRIVHGLGWAC